MIERSILTALIAIMLMLAIVGFVYELKFCHDYPGAQNCAWANALNRRLP